MRKRSAHSYRNDSTFRPPAHRVLLLLVISAISLNREAQAQTKPLRAAQSPLCTRENAIEMIKQQVGLSKTFNDTKQRISVLVRAGDVLWPYERARARAAFNQAFELAMETEKENDLNRPRSIILRLRVPDQRHIVIRAVAKRDSVWAKELIGQLLKADSPDASAAPTRDLLKDTVTADRLLLSASQLLTTDINAASDLARASLNYPASFMLTNFLYGLAGVNQQAADQLYAQALRVYGDKPMREFLYLQAYPFAWRETQNTPTYPSYQIPPTFVTNESLQRQFVLLALGRAQQALEAPLDESDSYRHANGTLMPGIVHLLHGLVRLEPQVRAGLPDLLAPLTEIRERILVSLSVDTQKLLLEPGREISTRPTQTFDERIESALKEPDLNVRDGGIVTALLGSEAEKESLARVIELAEKVSNSDLRTELLEWTYFGRANAAINDKQFEEAMRLTAKVEGLEQRAYLHTQIAKGLLERGNAKSQAQEVLDETLTEARKAGMTIFAARTLLTAATLYAKIDLSRSVSVLAEAINCINRIEGPDFSKEPAMQKTPERKGRGGRYQGEYVFYFYMPGLDPESAFREMAKLDFDTSLTQSNALTDRFQRAVSTIGLAEVCLQQTVPKRKPKNENRGLVFIASRQTAPFKPH